MEDNTELQSLPKNELTTRLIFQDKQLSDWYSNFEKNENLEVMAYRNRALLNLCVYGICSYNNYKVRGEASRELIKDIIDDYDAKEASRKLDKPYNPKYFSESRVPKTMLEYYESVFGEGRLVYFTKFLENKRKQSNNGTSNGKTKIYALPGRLDIDEMENAVNTYKENAFASILLLPALLTLIYIVTVVVYFMFIK